MKKRNLLNILILFLAVITTTVKTYAEEVEQAINLAVQPFVSVTQQASSINTGSVKVSTGVHDGLSTVYLIQTNGTDENYDFTLTSTVNSDSGIVSGYSDTGNLIFTNINSLPTLSAINDAKNGGNNNPNVIAYPTSTTITSPMTSTFTPNYGAFGNCYVIRFNNGEEATFRHNVLGTPVNGSYTAGRDEAGSYQATITLSVTPKS